MDDILNGIKPNENGNKLVAMRVNTTKIRLVMELDITDANIPSSTAIDNVEANADQLEEIIYHYAQGSEIRYRMEGEQYERS